MFLNIKQYISKFQNVQNLSLYSYCKITGFWAHSGGDIYYFELPREKKICLPLKMASQIPKDA